MTDTKRQAANNAAARRYATALRSATPEMLAARQAAHDTSALYTEAEIALQKAKDAKLAAIATLRRVWPEMAW